MATMLLATHLLLTPRDIAIISMVYAYGGCTADHVGRRFFASPGARSACYERIARLGQAGFLARKRLGSLTGIGSGKAFLVVGPQAKPVLADVLGLNRSELGRRRMQAPKVIAHHLALCDARVNLEIAAAESNWCELQDWQRDGEVVLRARDLESGIEVPIIPDATFQLARANGNGQTFYVEMDLDTMAPKRMMAKLRAYLSYAAKEAGPVLFVVADARRQRAIDRWAQAEAQQLGADSTIFWITTRERIEPATVLDAPIWQIVGGPAAVSLASIAEGKAPAEARLGTPLAASGGADV